MSKFFNPFTKKEDSIGGKGNTKPKDEEVSLSERLYQEYRATAEPWRRQAKEDEDFRNGAQWTSEEIKALKAKGQTPIVVNVIHPAVEQAKSLLAHNAPRFTATAREDADTRVAHVFADIMQYIWQISNGNMHLKNAIDDYYVKGMGAMLAYFDPYEDFGKGEVYVRSLDAFDLFIDPNSKSPYADDAAHIIIAKKMTTEQVLAAYPNMKDRIKNAQPNEDDIRPYTNREGTEGQTDVAQSQMHQSYTVIDRYSKVKVGKYHLSEPQSQFEKVLDADEYAAILEQPVVTETTANGVKYIIDIKEVIPYLDLYKESNGVYHYEQDPNTGQPVMMFGPANENSIPDSEVILNVLTMKDFIENGIVLVKEILVNRIKRVLSVGGERIYVGIIPIDTYPIVTFMNRHNGHPYPLSDVRFVRGLQEYINKIRSLIIAHASSSTNVKLLLPRGSTNKKEIEREWAKAGTGVIEYDPEIGTPIVAGPVPLPNELYKNEIDAKKDIQDILGIYTLGAGDPSAAHESFRGTVALDEFAQRRIKSKRDDIEGALNQLASVVIQLVQAYWTEPKTIRIVQPNDDPKEIFLNKPLFDDYQKEIGKINDITVGKYDIVVVSGSTLPSNRYAKFDYFMRLYEANIIDQVEVLKQTEVADMRGVLERSNIIQKLMGQVQQLQQQLKNLAGDTQTLQRENIHLDKKVQVEKFKTKLAEAEAGIRGAQRLFEARLNDTLKNNGKDNGKDNTNKS